MATSSGQVVTETAPGLPPTKVETPQIPELKGWRIDLFRRVPLIKWIAQRRWFQFAAILPNLFVFLLLITAGIFGSPVGNRNSIIVFVWILWWFLLISILVPFASRIWCAMCPFPFFGEWMQRRALIRVRAIDPKKQKKDGPGTIIGRNRYFGANRRWPKALSNIWIQNIFFLALCTFSALFLTRPIVSVLVLSSIFLAATVFHTIYRQRVFCNYVCPVSGFLSLYSMTSMLEVRSRDEKVCASCKEKACLAGSDTGWGCPWSLYPSKVDRNNYCGLCMECAKTCTHDNMTVNLRPFCSDTKLKGYDEAWKAFIMLSLATTYSVIYLGPWAFLKNWANIAESRNWLGFFTYTAILWSVALVLVPGIYATTVIIGKRLSGATEVPFKDAFLGMAYSFVPMGLLAWVAFSFPLMLVNGSYILMTLSDPFGWGWDLFGTGHIPWTPVLPHWTPFIQVILLLIGLHYALKTGYARARIVFGSDTVALKAFAPVAGLLAVCVGCFLFLYVG